ncbi:hypothetical protein AAG570_010214 [Ranatra chinensis]|uniref:Trehalase n=1 Tax=Ranatra chinensis TaxID=642074 RepID=A0ABD0YLZ7_9HEMI
MYRSARGVLMNLVLMVRQYKHLPKANRVYFLGRTDAPLLTPIADDYVRFTSDWDLLRNILTTLQVEFDYWIKVRTSMLQTRYHVFLAALDAKEKIPRAETYAEDWMAKVNEYGVLDENFIARRFWGRTGTDRRAIGVYLNSLMELNARLLAKYCLRFEMVGQARLYDRMSRELRKTVETLLFDTKRGRWADYDVTSGHVPGCSPGCVAPLWTGTGRGDTEGLPEGLGECVEVWRSGGGGAGPELQGLVAAGLSCCPQLRPIGLDLASSWLSSLPSPSRLPLTSAAISLYLLHLYPEVEICSLKITTPNRIITNKLLLSLCLILPFAYNFHSLY